MAEEDVGWEEAGQILFNDLISGYLDLHFGDSFADALPDNHDKRQKDCESPEIDDFFKMRSSSHPLRRGWKQLKQVENILRGCARRRLAPWGLAQLKIPSLQTQ